MAEVRIYTTTWCPDCQHAKAWLDRRGVAYEEINVETTPGAAEYVMSVNNGKRKVPTFVINADVFHNSPYRQSIMEEKFGA